MCLNLTQLKVFDTSVVFTDGIKLMSRLHVKSISLQEADYLMALNCSFVLDQHNFDCKLFVMSLTNTTQLANDFSKKINILR